MGLHHHHHHHHHHAHPSVDAHASISLHSAEAHSRLMRSATLAALAVATALIGLKTWAWLASGSLSMLASLVDSGLDGLTSLINFLAVRYALQPADDEHRFGHGKAEDMAGLVQSLVITCSAGFVMVRAIPRLLAPEPIANSALAIGVMVASTLLTLALVAYQRHVIRRTRSVAVRADHAHYAMDVLSNLGVLAAIGLSYVGSFMWVDPAVALVAAGMILYGAWGIGHDAFQRLMDREFSDAEREQITAIACAHPQALGIHDLRTRQAGIHQFIQFHLDLDGNLPLHEAHRITEEIEANVLKAYPKAEIFIHQDPK